MWPLLLGLLGVGAVGSQLLGGETIAEGAEDIGEVIGPVIGSAVKGTYTTTIEMIRGNEVAVFTAITVLALTAGAYTYGRALLSR
jgi:hypothetical protein